MSFSLTRHRAARWVILATAVVVLAPAPSVRSETIHAKCVKGMAATFPCRKIDLLAQVPLGDLGSGRLSDVWGWVDPDTGKEYALVGSSRGLLFVDVSNPSRPKYLGNLLLKAEASLIWQDVEVFQDRAYVVCDLSPCGLQIFDLTRLRDATAAQSWTPDLVYPVSLSTHTLDINPDTGFLYLNGSYLSGGSQILDINSPTAPVPAGFIADDGYTHDTHCRTYRGPDKTYRGKEICFAFNEDTITLYDMTLKTAPTQLAKVTYTDASYVHSGWLTEDHRYLLSSDEADESGLGIPGTTYLWDVQDLEDPKLIGEYEANSPAIDHNVYIDGKWAWHASYNAGVRLLDTTHVGAGTLKEHAFFDVVPESDDAGFNGTWSVYPWLPSGTVLATGMGQGLFLLDTPLD